MQGTSKSSLVINANEKLLSAQTLAESGHFYDAIYLCGYATELLLKAVVCTKRNWSLYPDNQPKYRTHNLEKLIDLAEIRQLLTTSMAADIEFQINWSLATSWSPEMRYRMPGTCAKENWNDFYSALTDVKKGVLSWLKNQL